VRTSLAVLLLVASGCALAGGAKEDRRAAARLEQVRSGAQTACGSLSRIGGDPWVVGQKQQEKGSVIDSIVPSAVEACARFEPALREGKSLGSVLSVRLEFGITDQRYLPEHWHVELVTQTGLVVYAGELGTGRAEEGACVMGVCTAEGSATVLLAEPWRPGRYKVRLVHVPTETRADLSFELD